MFCLMLIVVVRMDGMGSWGWIITVMDVIVVIDVIVVMVGLMMVVE